ncbi:lipopolysaccharide biosynthesis protein [Pontixanthobacter gangjinensis]|uniref:Lipopolysaccharide biosynthesis protein n=1 Tax=Christiangramia aestuarii TaxID=1028746 RepID=A0A7K1LN12_9FLAO|nr:lipopolysaccharide biosynthesis protein [Christiangramia aestuarii]MUP42199.1 lipopolysaccharide biosynthesis protein [Christiangramia aestuarii]
MIEHKKAIKHGAKWTFVGYIAQKTVVFAVGIVLARILDPMDFGLLGMIMVFVNLFDIIVDSGFGYVVVRYRNIDRKILDSILTLNVLLGIICFILLNITSDYIAIFFREPKLQSLILPISFLLLINAFKIVPFNLNVRNLLFKERSKIDVVSAIASGILGITLAYNDFGVMSLIYQILFANLLSTSLHNFISDHKINFFMDRTSVNMIWKRSHKIFSESITSTIFNNLNKIIIGRYFSAQLLGFYTRGHSFPSFTQKAIVQVVQKSIFPVYAKIEDGNEVNFIARKTIRTLCIIYMPIILVLAAISKNLILLLLTVKWEESIFFAQILAIASSLFAPQMVLRNVLKSRNDKSFLISENTSKVTRLILLIGLIPFGIKWVIIGQVINGVITLLVSGYFTKKEIGYTLTEQFADYGSLFFMAILLALPSFLLDYLLDFSYVIELAIQLITFSVLYLLYLKFKRFNIIKIFT